MSDTNGVTIPLPEIENFEDRIIEACARQMLESRSYDEDGDEVRYKSALGRKIEDAMLEAIKEQAREAAPDVAREILGTRTVTQVDRWGDDTGRGAQSLTAVIGEELLKALKGHSHSGSGAGVMRKIIAEEVEQKLRGEMVTELNAAKMVVLEALREESDKVMQLALSNAIGRLG